MFASFWGLPPLLVAAVVFAIDFGAILGIRIVVERQLYVKQWWTFRYGDSVYLPLYGAFVAARLQHGVALPVAYESGAFHLGLLALGYALMLATEWIHHRAGDCTWRDQLVPSQLYHSAIFGPMFYLVASTLPILALDRSPDLATLGAGLALAGYLLAAAKDYAPRLPRIAASRAG